MTPMNGLLQCFVLIQQLLDAGQHSQYAVTIFAENNNQPRLQAPITVLVSEETPVLSTLIKTLSQRLLQKLWFIVASSRVQ